MTNSNLTIGSKAPIITLPDAYGQMHTIPKIGSPCIIFFYPKDLTPGCTAQACSIRDGHQALSALGYTIYGVSVDSQASHQKFIDKHQLSYTLLSDVDKQMVNAYGVWGTKKFMGREYQGTFRTTFIIDRAGIITHIIDKVDTKNANQQLLDILYN